MLAIHARYRGRSLRRAELVQRSAHALSTLDGVGEFEVLGVEDICAVIDSAASVCDVVMALLADGEWAIGIGITPGSEVTEPAARGAATAALKTSARAGQVYTKMSVRGRAEEATDIAAAFALLGLVLHKRTLEGREATSLVRSGLNQNEAAEQLGISKQAMSQRLQAAGWAAETAGWSLALHLLERANTVAVA
ncbi:MAG: MarR family transcriptional regulator [Corynebacterium flavescens]|uniref:MarR family transcriptional regulator n=1 Tax=Corynebacterium flavescens TaxID=28028 RepID=UPI002647AB34|nr:MarR family transcriptional regulator [Corynebacterium flavescens]MDN6553146.1 MarR family transcriptional regulator [Corynebacterium flavescens]